MITNNIFRNTFRFALAGTVAAICAVSCGEAPIGQTATDKTPPPPLANIQAEPTPGGAKITYTLPKETDISYVKGEFVFQGKPKVIRASVYDNFMIIEGLNKVEPITVTLRLVDHSENHSASATVTFTPDTPPIDAIFASLKMNPDFGGVEVTWDNPQGVEIGVTLYATKADGNFDDGRIFFSPAKAGRNVYRGMEPVESKFGIKITDKWGNMSEIKEFTTTPMLETMYERAKLKQHILPYDNSSDQYGQAFTFLFDGEKTTTGNRSWHSWENQDLNKMGYTVPILFTVDLGVEGGLLSRFLLWQGRYSTDFLYSHHNPRFFEVWGTTTLVTGQPDVYWHEDWKKDWTLLGDFELVKPSGLPMGQRSNEDVAVADAGHEFIPLLTPVRYVRFSIKSTWVGNRDNTITIHELEFWGTSAGN